jgi:hypothetical protein
MPFYYDMTFSATTNGTTNTLSTHLGFRTVANQLTARVVALYAAAKMAAAGGGCLLLTRCATANSAGTAIGAPNGINKRHPDSPTAGTTVFTSPTAGGTPSVQLKVGFAQTGGQGGWVALEPDHAFTMKANAGASGNGEIGSLAVGTSQLVDITCEFNES